MRLYVDILASKQLFGTFSRQFLHHINAFTAAIVSLTRIAFSIFVRQRTAHSCHDSLTYPVLGCDQLDMRILPLLLRLNSLRYLRICCSYFLQ